VTRTSPRRWPASWLCTTGHRLIGGRSASMSSFR
jgi:hypothetical protein